MFLLSLEFNGSVLNQLKYFAKPSNMLIIDDPSVTTNSDGKINRTNGKTSFTVVFAFSSASCRALGTMRPSLTQRRRPILMTRLPQLEITDGYLPADVMAKIYRDLYGRTDGPVTGGQSSGPCGGIRPVSLRFSISDVATARCFSSSSGD